MSIVMTILFMILGIAVWEFICEVRKVMLAVKLEEANRNRAMVRGRQVNQNMIYRCGCGRRLNRNMIYR